MLYEISIFYQVFEAGGKYKKTHKKK
jgi:hypothetical protein